MWRQLWLPVLGASILSLSAIEAHAQQKTAEVASLVSSTPDADGSHTLTFALKEGGPISLKIPPQIAVQAISALSAPTGSGPNKNQVVAVVQQMTIGINADGSAIVLLPKGKGGPLEPLGIPVAGAENFINLFQEKLGEARKKAAQPK